MATSSRPAGDSPPIWHLGWFNLADFKGFLANSDFQLTENSLVYLGSQSMDDVVYWGIDVSEDESLVPQFGAKHFCFVELRTLMVATDWTDERAMSDLAIAGHVSGYDSWIRVPFFFGSKCCIVAAEVDFEGSVPVALFGCIFPIIMNWIHVV